MTPEDQIDLLMESLTELELPDNEARAGWNIQAHEVMAAKRKLGIRLNISIRFTSGRNTHGTHSVRKAYNEDRYYHRITLSQNKNADSASETLWHEMAHAMQSEAWARASGKPPTKFYRLAYMNPAAKGAWGETYHMNKFEQHARDVANKNYKTKLVR